MPGMRNSTRTAPPRLLLDPRGPGAAERTGPREHSAEGRNSQCPAGRTEPAAVRTARQDKRAGPEHPNPTADLSGRMKRRIRCPRSTPRPGGQPIRDQVIRPSTAVPPRRLPGAWELEYLMQKGRDRCVRDIVEALTPYRSHTRGVRITDWVCQEDLDDQRREDREHMLRSFR